MIGSTDVPLCQVDHDSSAEHVVRPLPFELPIPLLGDVVSPAVIGALDCFIASCSLQPLRAFAKPLFASLLSPQAF